MATKDDTAPVAPAVVIAPAPVAPDVENVQPETIWASFDDFFLAHARKHGINPNWKEVVKMHVKQLGWLADQSKWHAGVKHFGC